MVDMPQLKRKHPLSALPDCHASEIQLRDAIQSKLIYALGKSSESATSNDWYQATALAVRDRVVDIWRETRAETKRLKKKRVYYLSIEFLIGRLLLDTLTNLRLVEPVRGALASMGVDLDGLRRVEPDAALGNGGLGRLAACFMDSMSALGIPAYGYGIRYENGLFEQKIHDGWQHEFPEDWLSRGNPWEFARSDSRYSVGFGGSVEYLGGDDATARAVWSPSDRGASSARRRRRARAEAISRILYPNDPSPEGQELRLRQEYFFTSATLQDLTRRHLDEFGSLETLADYAAVQLNDTHPAIAVAELMRILVDEHDFSWSDAWTITKATLSYTNHTLLPEALESWPVELFGRLLPRHLQIIYRINWFHLQETENRGLADPEFLSAVSLVHENGEKRVRMAHLAFLGSHCVNGVSQLHTDLLRKTVFHNLAKTAPTRIVNKTNGITFRRWLYEANGALTDLLINILGERVLDDPSCLQELEHAADDTDFVARYKQARAANKSRLANLLRATTGVQIQPHALFDVHIKRIHEYKRQLLNILEIIAVYQDIRARPNDMFVPRVKIFAGKAAANYERAKLIIKLANDVAWVINGDPVVGDRLKVVFAPNYSASLAEEIIPAADLSEQISTAGMEASGTGNMKLALNGAITIGTLDGANIEIREHVGEDNVVIFGMTASEVAEKQHAQFKGADAVDASPRLTAVVQSLASGELSPDDPSRFAPIVQSLLDYDRFMVAADFDAYWDAQRSIDRLWQSPADWWRVSILNTARMGWFSSDRAVREYAREIWRVPVS